MDKKKLGIIFGGKSGEHEVSLMSATSIIQVIDRNIYDLLLIGITKSGKWVKCNENDISSIIEGKWANNGTDVFLSLNPDCKGFYTVDNNERNFHHLDIIFPILHGPNGEDGTIQGLFEVLQIPYVSSNVISSALAMDKAFSKQIFENVGLPVLDYQVYNIKQFHNNKTIIIKDIENDLGYPCFVKPCNMGSSIGISKANNQKELYNAVETAFLHDNKILIEEYIDAREIELSILGNENPKVSIPGEIKYANEFYDYEAKYFDAEGTELIIPASLTKTTISRLQEVAIKAYKALNCTIFARADFFYDELKDKIYINELNTIPGFTNGSMYPKLWEATGISYPDLVNKLLNLTIERHKAR